MQIPLIQGSKVDDKTAHTITRQPVNTYEKDGKMRTIGGLRLFSETKGRDRNGFFINTGVMVDHFRVVDDQLISFSFSGAQDYIDPSQLIAGKDRVKFEATVQNLIFCAGGKYYLYNPTDGLRICEYFSKKDAAKPDDPPVPDPTDPLGDVLDLTYIKQSVVLLVYDAKTDTVRMAQSEPQQDTVFIRGPEIDDTDPDRSVAIEAETDYFILFNRKTITFWYAKNTDPSSFSYVPAESKQIEGGIVARDAKARIMNSWAVLSITVPGQEPNIYLLGSILQPIGSIEIQNIIKRYSEADLSLTVMESYQQDGIDMLVVHLPFDTLLFNSANGLWSILQSRDESLSITQYRAINMVRDERSNQFIVGDKFKHKLGVLDQTIGNEYGLPICQVLYTPYELQNRLIRHLVINGNFGDWPDDTMPLIRLQMTRSGIAYGNTLAIRLPKGRHYTGMVSHRNLGYIRGLAGFRLQIDTMHKLEFDGQLYINESADAMVG